MGQSQFFGENFAGVIVGQCPAAGLEVGFCRFDGAEVSSARCEWPARQKIHYALMLRNMRYGWTLDQRREYFAWFPEALKAKGFTVYLKPSSGPSDGRWRVRVGPLATKSDAQRLARRLEREES